MFVLPGVLGPLALRRTNQVRLDFDCGFRISDLGFSVRLMISNLQFGFGHLFSGSHELFRGFSIRIQKSAFHNSRPGCTPIFAVSQRRFVNNAG